MSGGFSSTELVTTYNKTITGSGLIRLVSYKPYYVSSCGCIITVDGTQLLSFSTELTDLYKSIYIPFAKSVKIFCWYDSTTSVNSRGSITAHVVLF